jgi:hypothetical protein
MGLRHGGGGVSLTGHFQIKLAENTRFDYCMIEKLANMLNQNK